MRKHFAGDYENVTVGGVGVEGEWGGEGTP